MRGRTSASFVAAAMAVAVLLVVLIAPHASSRPDGLERVAADQGFAGAATEHRLAGGPLADYDVAGVEHEWLATATAGVAGVVATFAVGALVMVLLRARRRRGVRRAAAP